MLAIDTNVIVRFLVEDEVDQAARARRLIDSEDVFVATTVLLETEWVLRSTYGLQKARVLEAFARFIGMPQVKLEQPRRVILAIAWSLSGLEFADALHLAAAEGCEAFMSFDRGLIASRATVDGVPVREP